VNQTRVVRLVDAHARRRDRIQSVLLRVILRLLRGMPSNSWYDERAVQGFAAEAAKAVREAQQQVGEVTFQYLTAVLEEMGLQSLARNPDLTAQLRDIEPAVEWSRPAEQFRYAKSIGKSDTDAQKAAETRAEILADEDLALGMQHATVTLLRSYPQVIGYRRVIHPELSKSGTCGLCAVASDRTYQSDRLMPVHDRCKCGVLPITSEWDPGSPLNDDDLRRLYNEAGGTAGDKLKRTRFQVTDHSELGPRLVAA
jgi:hypothetical protein